MTSRQTRRQFLKHTAAFTGALAGSRLFCAPSILADAETRGKLRTAIIGCGGRGQSALTGPAMGENLVAFVDVDENNIAKAIKRVDQLNKMTQGSKPVDASKIKTFTDYRKFFDTMGKDFDAVFIAPPNHHHALPSLMAMKLGKHVYTEKPMAYNIHEARTMAEYARQYKVATQMGNQGHSAEGVRRFREYIEAGAIGNVTEVHTWSDRSNGGVGPRPPKAPVPEGLHWDGWIGPAPFRDFHEDLHPHEWHNWHDFGNGSLGNMGCHILDPVFWVFNLGHPATIEAELIAGGTKERYPIGTRICWTFEAREGKPAMKVYWYDGVLKPTDRPKQTEAGKTMGLVSQNAAYRPPIVVETEKKYKRNFGANGALYIGDKGMMITDAYGGAPRIVPEEQHQKFPAPEKKFARITGTHQDDFFRACRGGQPAASNFDYASRLTEMALLGCLAIKAGVHKKLEWDGDKCTNNRAINHLLTRENRKGWNV